MLKEKKRKVLPNGLRYPRWGGRRDAVRLEKCSGVGNCLKMPQNPQRRVHALLGAFCKTADLAYWTLYMRM
jgi:hypothetical protein